MDPVPTEATLARLYNQPGETFCWFRDDENRPRTVVPTDEPDYARLLRWLPEERRQGRLLDLGCATGGFLATASRHFQVEGCELNASTAAAARAAGFEVHVGTAASHPGLESFDVITMLQVIEHLPVPRDVLRDVHRLLRPGGHLYIATPNVDSSSFHLLRERHTHVHGFGHVSLFNRKSLIGLLERSGFELVAHEYCPVYDFSLHDWVSLKLANRRFVHRMALYSPRLYYGCNILDGWTGGLLSWALRPAGNPSYQAALFRKVESDRGSAGP